MVNIFLFKFKIIIWNGLLTIWILIARTKSLVDHFEGDIGPLKLVKTTGMKKLDQSETAECKMSCNEAIQINLIGNENLIVSIWFIKIKKSICQTFV